MHPGPHSHAHRGSYAGPKLTAGIAGVHFPAEARSLYRARKWKCTAPPAFRIDRARKVLPPPPFFFTAVLLINAHENLPRSATTRTVTAMYRINCSAPQTSIGENIYLIYGLLRPYILGMRVKLWLLRTCTAPKHLSYNIPE